MRKSYVTVVGLLSVVGASSAQSDRPYAGMEQRPVKSYSDRQLADLRAGRGMGLALPAELNGYPGPSHVVDLAGQLGLSPDQVGKVRELFASMTAEAVTIGNRLIEQEAGLDGLFASRQITLESLATATRAIGATQADLRVTHLKYHLATAAVLSPEQMERYSRLRGYRSLGGEGPGSHRHH